MKKEICTPLGYCMYCENPENPIVTDEHVIAECMGGELIIPKSTCNDCSDKTSRIEMHVARETLFEARAKFNAPSKRRNKYPKTLPIKLLLAKDELTVTEEVPVKEAPIFIVIPCYIYQKTEGENLLSSVVLQSTASTEDSNEKAIQTLLAKFGAHSVELYTGSLKIKMFELMLWKFAYGFFWLASPESVRQSDISSHITDSKSPFQEQPLLKEDKLYVLNLTSKARKRGDTFKASARIYSLAEESHKFIYCDLDFMSPFGLPIYTCRIKNVNSQPITEVHYSAE